MPSTRGVTGETATITAPAGAEVLPRVAILARPATRATVLDAHPAARERPLPPELQQATHCTEPL